MLQVYFSLRQFWLIKWSFFIQCTMPYIHLRLDSPIEPKFSYCLVLPNPDFPFLKTSDQLVVMRINTIFPLLIGNTGFIYLNNAGNILRIRPDLDTNLDFLQVFRNCMSQFKTCARHILWLFCLSTFRFFAGFRNLHEPV